MFCFDSYKIKFTNKISKLRIFFNFFSTILAKAITQLFTLHGLKAVAI